MARTPSRPQGAILLRTVRAWDGIQSFARVMRSSRPRTPWPRTDIPSQVPGLWDELPWGWVVVPGSVAIDQGSVQKTSQSPEVAASNPV
jgi:hypothetical protein